VIHLTVREYATLTLDAVAPNLDRAQLTETAFDHLCNLNARLAHGNALLRIENRRTLRLSNYVGVLETPCGTSIEILPKHVDDATDPVPARALLRRMLLDTLDLPARHADEASIEMYRVPLTEWVMRRFLGELDRLTKRGLRFDYVRLDEEQRFLRGQWDIARQMRQPPGREHYFQIRHDVFLPDRPENRLLRAALDKVCRNTTDPENWRLSHELALLLAEIPASTHIPADFSAWRTDRMMAQYREVRPWCRLVLGQEMPLALQGPTAGLSMLFPMEKVFEKHVAVQLQRVLRPGLELICPASREDLCTHQDRGMFRLEPDLLFTHGKSNVAVMDTKWKRVDAAKRSDNYDLSQADFYQLYAYGQKYLNGRGTMALIYPRTPTFPAPLPPFDFTSELRLWVLPFDLDAGCLMLPTGPVQWPVRHAEAPTAAA
jgi:5-methylcytosine-specific restriction enzyme subunit McrC